MTKIYPSIPAPNLEDNKKAIEFLGLDKVDRIYTNEERKEINRVSYQIMVRRKGIQ